MVRCHKTKLRQLVSTKARFASRRARARCVGGRPPLHHEVERVDADLRRVLDLTRVVGGLAGVQGDDAASRRRGRDLRAPRVRRAEAGDARHQDRPGWQSPHALDPRAETHARKGIRRCKRVPSTTCYDYMMRLGHATRCRCICLHEHVMIHVMMLCNRPCDYNVFQHALHQQPLQNSQ